MDFYQKNTRKCRIELLEKIKMNKRLELSNLLKIISELDKQILLEKCLIDRGE